MWRILIWIGFIVTSVEWWIATRLPRRIAYLCTARVAAEYACKHPTTEVPTITVIQAMDGWMDKKKV